MSDETEFADIVVSGRVQGVGYREFARRAAEARGLAGFACNRADGTVEARLVGARREIDAALADLRRGPPHARVSELRIVAQGSAEPESGFVIKPTA